MANNKQMLLLFLLATVACITSCSHQSKVKPSNGHIDGANNSNPQTSKKSAYKKPLSNPLITPSDVAPSAFGIPKPVTNSVYLPPPKAKAKEPVYSIVVYDTPVKEVLFAIARDSKLNVDIHPSIQGRVTLNAVDQTLPAILERLSKQVDLTYNIHNNVLSIAPDQPVLRTYKVDYVNINRDTVGFIGAAAEIAGIGQGAPTGVGGAGQAPGGAGAGGGAGGAQGQGRSNSSRTAVNSEGKNHLWESLIQNIKDLLAETDKEVIVTRFGGLESNESGQPNQAATELRREQQSEYKTLFAANVIANPETGVISVRATNKQHQKVQEFIDRVMNSAKKQVLIEATIVEVALSDSFQAGIDWSRLGNTASSNGFNFRQSLNSQTGLPTTVGNDSSPGLIAAYLNPVSRIGNIAASISLLQQFGDIKVLSSPKLMVLNNQTAVLKVVRNFVYFTIQSQISQGNIAGGGNLQATTASPQTVPIGVVMSVTPQINDLSSVNLNVRPTISRLFGNGKPDPTNPANIIPEVEVREMESILQISSGNTAVLGGLMQDEIQRNSDRVPGLSNLPGVGRAFRGRDEVSRKTELVIFLRPTVITNASLESDELATYKQYLPSEQLKQTINPDVDR